MSANENSFPESQGPPTNAVSKSPKSLSNLFTALAKWPESTPFVRYYMNRIGAVISFAVISLYTAVGMIALMLWLGRAHGAMPLWRMSGADLLLLVLSAVVGISLGHVCYYASIARLGVAIAAGVTLLAPFLTAIGSFVLYRERLTAGQWLGGVASTIGALMILATQRRLSARSATSGDGQVLPNEPAESGGLPTEPRS